MSKSIHPASSAVDRLAARIGEALGTEVELERPKDPAHGDFATNVAMRSAKAARRPPRELAQEYAERLSALDGVTSAEVAGPGFLNIRVADEFFLDALAEIGEGYGGGFADPAERVQVELVSANPTGPIVVSAARNGAYGDCVARLLAFGGHEVAREYYYNDAGAQMDRFRESIAALRRGEPVAEDGYRGAYVEELARADGDPVPKMLASIEDTMERFRIHFDSWVLQSELEQRLPELLPRLDTYERDGALWARSSAYGDEQDWVLVRSADKGGTPTYRAADVAYLVDKLGRGFDRAIYVLGADHHATARWYAAIARMLGYDPGRVEVLLYQFVHLTRGGETTKASKRAGNVVFLDDVMDEIGVDATRWYLVNRGPDQTIEIDLDLAAEKSQKNPVYYVQYAHARIAAILRNAETAEVGGPPPGPLAAEEKELIKRLTDFPATVRESAGRRGPQLLPSYAIRLADDFHRFYHECRVLGDPAQAFRLGLCRATQQVIARSLDLVGVEAPERM
ncbi:MAG TPA: arginine--tRNA ligase [Gaiellaceae bacterium]|nr:arginine--tRNA ligase [Gaiellaceae bacterium]